MVICSFKKGHDRQSIMKGSAKSLRPPNRKKAYCPHFLSLYAWVLNEWVKLKTESLIIKYKYFKLEHWKGHWKLNV